VRWMPRNHKRMQMYRRFGEPHSNVSDRLVEVDLQIGNADIPISLRINEGDVLLTGSE
jgi:hypothetical protein